MTKDKLKKFIIKKYVMAKSASDALRKERHIKADDCWVDEEWRKTNEDKVVGTTGFTVKKRR